MRIRDYRVHGAVRVPHGKKGLLRSHRKHDPRPGWMMDGTHHETLQPGPPCTMTVQIYYF